MTIPAPGGGGNTLGGAAGTLAGTAMLQTSIDNLTTAVNRLTSAMGSGTLGAGSGGGTGGGYAARAAAGGGGFPAMAPPPGINRQPGIGGGGPGGTGNISAPTRMGMAIGGLGMIGSGLSGYGQGQMPFQLGLNAYASMSMMGMNNVGMNNYAPTFSQLSNQPGLPVSSSPMDFLAMTRQLSFLGGAPNYMSTAMGRAGFGATAAFGMTNPTLSGAAAANLAQQVYNPMLSMRMRLLGYNTTPRVMGSGMPQTMGNVVSSLIQGWYGRSRVNPAQLYKTLSFGGKGYTNLSYLGLNPQQMAPVMEGFNKLFNAGYTPQEASTLFAQAASNNPNIAGKAQNQLRNAGVTSVTSDIQKMKNNQAQISQRAINTAPGFNAALTSATDSLKAFNSALNSILTNLHLNGALGATGGLFGVLAGTSHGNILNTLGGVGMLGLAARGAGLLGGGAGAGGGLLGGLGGILGGAGSAISGAGAGILGALGGGAGMAAGAATLGSAGLLLGGLFGLSKLDPMTIKQLNNDPAFRGRFGPTTFPNQTQTVGGGAAIPMSQQQQNRGRSNTMSNISSAAAKAVHSAETQLGVPYVWGDEAPGVGFDCSGLVQWAYKQAGINIPRTTFAMWATMKNKRVPLSSVQEGDLVFAAGSDGTATNPGHVAMMINKHQIIQAPFTGTDVQIDGFNPRQWIGAIRPSGKGSGMASGNANNTISTSGSGPSPGLSGSRGLGGPTSLGDFGSINEVDIINAMGGGGMGFGGSGLSGLGSGSGGISTMAFPNKNSSLTTGGRGPKGNGSRNIQAEKAFAMQLLNARHWGNQFGSLNNIIMRESGWRWNAQNQGSGAYGIPQALPGSKMAAAGSDWRTNPDTQLRWMIDMYIPQRYGTPNNAWQFWQQNGWYGGGGMVKPGMSIVGDRGPELLLNTGGGSMILNNSQTMQMLKGISQPQQTPFKNLTAGSYGGNVIYPGQGMKSQGMSVTLNFSQNSICISMPAGTSTDSQSAGNAMAKQFVSALQQEEIWHSIAQGTKN